MKTHLIPIGNSKGIRIPKSILETCGLEEEIEMVIQKDGLILRPLLEVRSGWDKSFKAMSANNEDTLIIEDQNEGDEKRMGVVINESI